MCMIKVKDKATLKSWNYAIMWIVISYYTLIDDH